MKVVKLPKVYIEKVAKLYRYYCILQNPINFNLYRAVLDTVGYYVFGLYKANKMVGFTTIFEKDLIIVITHTYILPKYRRYLKSFNLLIEEYYKDKLITIPNFKDNKKAQQLYYKLGYKEIQWN